MNLRDLKSFTFILARACGFARVQFVFVTLRRKVMSAGPQGSRKTRIEHYILGLGSRFRSAAITNVHSVIVIDVLLSDSF